MSPQRTSGERSFGEFVDDATITAAVKSKLLWSKHTEGRKVDVDTLLGKVTLLGAAENATAKEMAGRMARNTRGVVAIDNQLVVDDSKPISSDEKATPVRDAARVIADSWITTKVKSTYIYSRNVESSDISVSTKDGNVTLTGKVGSGEEGALAIELAQNVRGVKSVVATDLVF